QHQARWRWRTDDWPLCSPLHLLSSLPVAALFCQYRLLLRTCVSHTLPSSSRQWQGHAGGGATPPLLDHLLSPPIHRPYSFEPDEFWFGKKLLSKLLT
ncbi:hypothetical protein U1Q18_007603, partial [Sarracenia purpurea var. burkii]